MSSSATCRPIFYFSAIDFPSGGFIGGMSSAGVCALIADRRVIFCVLPVRSRI